MTLKIVRRDVNKFKKMSLKIPYALTMIYLNPKNMLMTILQRTIRFFRIKSVKPNIKFTL